MNIFFDICDKVSFKPDLNQFRRGFRKCRREQNKEKKEAMLLILKENFTKYYPNEKIESE